MALAPAAALAETPNAKGVFAKLATLVGDWTTDPAKGRVLKVSFSLTSADTVLVERWQTASGRESLTLYHLDGVRVVATHYCPIGNQPRLVLDQAASPERPSFSFLDATGIDGEAESHLTKLWLHPDGNTLRRGETYTANGKDEASVLTLLRVPRPSR